jgi:hypothetical protein
MSNLASIESAPISPRMLSDGRISKLEELYEAASDLNFIVHPVYDPIARVETLIKTRAKAAMVIATRQCSSWPTGLDFGLWSSATWSQVEFSRSASLHLRRAKNGKPRVHPLRGTRFRCCASFAGSFRTRVTSCDRARRSVYAGCRQSADQAHR